MERLLENARALAAEYDMLPAGCTVVCAVSGGADSMCLLHYLTQREDLTVHAAHFDHRLRGEESARDAEFVRDWCEKHNIPFHLGSGDVAAEAKRLKLGIEETARAMRYTYLYNLARELGAERVATAHNADDNAETLLLHLLRGSALRGLGGIEPRLSHLVRPLLTTSRGEIEDYLARHGIPHVEDATNQEDTFLRNRVRHQLIPLLEELNPGFVRRTAQAIPRLREDEKVLEAQARALFRQHAQDCDGDLIFPAPVLAQTPPPIALRCIRLLLDEANEGLGDCASAHLEAVLEMCKSGSPSGEVHLPYALTALREYDKLVLTHAHAHAHAPLPFEAFAPIQGENPIPGTAWMLVLGVSPWPGLTVRPRKTGDSIALSGRPRKSVKELFIDEKVPRRKRAQVPLLADGDGVIALAGFGDNTSHPRAGTARFISKKEEREL